MGFRYQIKRLAARAARITPKARYNRSLLVLSHMRATTTALSNVLCTHDSISGYGETHVPYADALSPGEVIVNQIARRAYSSAADMLFDKVLHSRLDARAPAAFYQARAVFMVRHPTPTIASIVRLAARSRMRDVSTPELAAEYYTDRIEVLLRHWDRFPATQRFGLSAEALLADPDARVADLGRWLALDPPLTNAYVSHKATQIGGGGDPTRSALLDRIEPRQPDPDPGPVRDVAPWLAARCDALYREMLGRFSAVTAKKGDTLYPVYSSHAARVFRHVGEKPRDCVEQ